MTMRQPRPIGWPTIFLAVCASCSLSFSAFAARAVSAPGEAATPLSLKDARGELHTLDSKTSGPALLLFTKPDDRHTSEALVALNDMLLKHPDLKKGLHLWVIASRMEGAAKTTLAPQLLAPGWTLLLDEADVAYHAYRIVATPTVVLVGRTQTIEAVNPGYDLGMEDHMTTELARVMGVTLQEPSSEKASKARMYVMMGRRMAARGLWEQALAHYEQAEKEEPLTPDAKLDMARSCIEVGQLDQAEEILNNLPADAVDSKQVAVLKDRLVVLRGTKPKLGQPPRVTR
jgi:tetratricopeptide (TPR) repeat protein